VARHQRRHGKIHELPKDILKQVHDLLLEPKITYSDIVAFLKDNGHEVSDSAVGRYSEWFNEWRETEMLRDQAALIASDPATALDLEKMTSTMATTRFAYAMKKEGFDITEHPKLIAAFATMQASSVKREQWNSVVKERVMKTADDVSKIAKKGGLTDDAAAQIRAKILGIAK